MIYYEVQCFGLCLVLSVFTSGMRLDASHGVFAVVILILLGNLYIARLSHQPKSPSTALEQVSESINELGKRIDKIDGAISKLAADNQRSKRALPPAHSDKPRQQQAAQPQPYQQPQQNIPLNPKPAPIAHKVNNIAAEVRPTPSFEALEMKKHNAFMAMRMSHMWSEWATARQPLSLPHSKGKKVLVFPGLIPIFHMTAEGDDPKSDQLQWADLIAALAFADTEVTVVTTIPRAMQEFQRLDSFDRVFLDYAAARHYQEHGDKQIWQRNIHKYAILDTYGTEQKYNEMNYLPSEKFFCCLHLPSIRQFLSWIPDQIPDRLNTFLGFAVHLHEEIASTPKVPRQAFIWGKHEDFFKLPGVQEYMTQISNRGWKLHLTLKNPPAWLMRLNVVNHGVLPHMEFLRLLASSVLYVGLGIPVIGASAIEAVAYGCIYINPIYRPAITYKNKPIDRAWESQVELLAHLPEPHVYSVVFQDHDAVERLFDKLDTVQPQKSFVHPEFSMTAHLKRMDWIFSDQFPDGPPPSNAIQL